MKRYSLTVAGMFIILWFAISVPAAVNANVAAILEQMPADTVEEGQRLAAELLQLGPEGIQEVCGLLVRPGSGNDAAARYALNGLSLYVFSPNAGPERKMVSKVYIEALDAAFDSEVKAFLIRQLQLVGGQEAVPALGRYLADEQLCGPALQALMKIPERGRVKRMTKALPQVGEENRVAILLALGKLQARRARGVLRSYAEGDSVKTRQAAWYALANQGDPWIAEVLGKEVKIASSTERPEVASLYLLCARRLAEAGQKHQCRAICRDLLESPEISEEAQIACAALKTLVFADRRRALPELLEAVGSPNQQLRNAALELALTISGDTGVEPWIERIKEVSPEAQSEIITTLGRSGDPAALPALLNALESDEKIVRLSAIAAVARLGDDEGWPGLLAALSPTEDEDEVQALKGALLRFSSQGLLSGVANALPRSSLVSRVALLEILAARRANAYAGAVFAETRHEDKRVRIAAMKALGVLASASDLPRMINLLLDAQSSAEESAAQAAIAAVCVRIPNAEQRTALLLAALDRIEGEKRGVLLGTLSRIGGAPALQAVLRDVESADRAVQDAAVRALAGWPDTGAAEALLRIARSAARPVHEILALRGYIQLAGEAGVESADRLAMYKNALGIAKRLEEKRLVLAGLAETKTLGALEQVASLLDDASLAEEAAIAAVQIACPPRNRQQGLLEPEAAGWLRKAKSFLKDDGLIDAADRQLNRIAMHSGEGTDPDKDRAEGFVPLFNGLDLSGWTGDVKGYAVEEGRLVCLEGGPGNLYTKEEFANFILRFEFKLSPGANNGLGIRAPLEGNAAYAGMELQILDNTADQYQNLKPYQYHGSVYGVVPAKRGSLKPVGQWNDQEVIALGRRIVVNLNGTTIVDADLDQASRSGTMDGGEHPGLARDRGHIGFLGHGSRVEFRNLRVKKLAEGNVEPDSNALSEAERRQGFELLFDGKSLNGWKRHEDLPGEIGGKWTVEDGAIVGVQDPPGKGGFLTTLRSYRDFDLRLETRIEWPFDSGVFLRVGPHGKSHQVMLDYRPGGEIGGVYCPWTQGFVDHCTEGIKHFKPYEWNRMRILCQGEPSRIQVWMNDVLITDFQHTAETTKGIQDSGTICLQVHPGGKDFDKGRALFRSIRVREISDSKE